MFSTLGEGEGMKGAKRMLQNPLWGNGVNKVENHGSVTTLTVVLLLKTNSPTLTELLKTNYANNI